MRSRTRLLVCRRLIPDSDIHLLNPPASSSSSMKISLTLSYREREMMFYHARHGSEASLLNGFRRQLVSESLWLDFGVFDGYDVAEHALSPVLRRLEITDPVHHEAVVRRIIHYVFQMGRGVSRERKVLGLVTDIVRVRKIVCSGQDLIERAVRMSRMEFERRRNYGMVPTAKGALKLKCVKVKEGGGTEACTICLEELTEFAASMPCNHKFHGTCIAKWLKESHYCPICRFEMPTDQIRSNILID